MARCINFWRNRDGIGPGNILQYADILPGIRAIFCRQAREAVAVEAEGGIGMHPIRAVSGSNGIVVEMNVKIIHLIPRHEFHVVFQKTDGEKLAPGIKHEAAFCILWIISCDAPGNMRFREVLE